MNILKERILFGHGKIQCIKEHESINLFPYQTFSLLKKLVNYYTIFLSHEHGIRRAGPNHDVEIALPSKIYNNTLPTFDLAHNAFHRFHVENPLGFVKNDHSWASHTSNKQYEVNNIP
jgi:hypothetical protein